MAGQEAKFRDLGRVILVAEAASFLIPWPVLMTLGPVPAGTGPFSLLAVPSRPPPATSLRSEAGVLPFRILTASKRHSASPSLAAYSRRQGASRVDNRRETQSSIRHRPSAEDFLLDSRSLPQLFSNRLSCAAQPLYPFIPFIMKTYICPACGIEQDNVLVHPDYYLNHHGQDAYEFEWHCLGCQAVLDTQFLKDNDILAGPQAAYRWNRILALAPFIISGLIFGIVVALLIRCWLS